MKKRTLIPIFAITAAASVMFYQSYKIESIKDTIKKQLITKVNNTVQQRTDDTVLSQINNKIDLTRITNLADTYSVSLDKIYNEKLLSIKIEGSNYLSYCFDAEVKFFKDNNIYNKVISSKVIVDGKNNSFEIKSIDDLEQDLLKSLIQIKRENSEDFSEELHKLSLIYQNEELDIKINYPEYYTYNSFKTESKTNPEYNVSFYMDNDKSSNYIQFIISTSDTQKKHDYVKELQKQGYELLDKEFTTPSGIVFSVLTQNFTQNLKESTEIIYISRSEYKNIENLTITTKIDSSLLKYRQSEIEEVIKSFK